MTYVQGLQETAIRTGTYVTGTVGNQPGATIYRVGQNYLVVSKANVLLSYVHGADPGRGIVNVYEALGGR
jgi:hypothetical protein